MIGAVQDGEVLRNAFNKETFVFPRKRSDAVARFTVIVEEGGSGGGNALAHVHPEADEHFHVKRGRLRVVIEGREQIVEPGHTAVVPRGQPHYFDNAGDDTAEFSVEFRPSQRHLRFFMNFAQTVELHPEWFSDKGEPDFLLIALILHAYPHHLYLAGIPKVLQRVLFAVLAPVARLKGYRVLVPPDA